LISLDTISRVSGGIKRKENLGWGGGGAGESFSNGKITFLFLFVDFPCGVGYAFRKFLFPRRVKKPGVEIKKRGSELAGTRTLQARLFVP
jgi:hypothetical protein